MRYRVGADVGGTFTDLVAMDEEGRVIVAKTPTTPEDQSVGVYDAIKKAGIDLADVTFFSHGTTVGINAVIENKGAKVAIITTKGFRDVLELRRGQRVIDNPDDMYNLQMDLPQDYVGGYDPLVRRPLRFEVPERLDYQGNVLTSARRGRGEAGRRGTARPGRRSGGDLLPVLVHEPDPRAADGRDRAGDAARGPTCRSRARSFPIIREYERLSTATVNAYVMPIMQSYLRQAAGQAEGRRLPEGAST